ncbi:ENV2 protein, partial [Malurus elegans]|nr:ENV2 protein [Daphoenositta chrysoptera]NWV72440.1 ENV2 protein [Malurus elegans]NXB39710.1 ENV2 protein [Eulacestoma nigropectus]
GESETLWKMIKASYGVLNKTHPELTQECWLCYSSKPPYYDALGYTKKPTIKSDSNPPECIWGNRDSNTPGITLASVIGQGICVG